MDLIEESKQGNIAAVRDALEKGADVNAKSSSGGTALMCALEWVHIEIAKLLIEKGADVNAKNSSGGTALMSASMIGHTEIVKLLIEKGADVNAKNNECIIGGVTALMYASTFGHTETAELLIKKGTDVNAKNNMGQTALGLASVGGEYIETVRMLKDAGAR